MDGALDPRVDLPDAPLTFPSGQVGPAPAGSLPHGAEHGGSERLGAESATAAARRRVDAAGRGTVSLPELRRLVENQFLTGFSHRVWLTGEVDRPEVGSDGALHFELVSVEDGSDWLRLECDVPADALPELRSLLHRVSDADLDDVIAAGRAARVGGLLRYDFRVHRLALVVSAVDPSTTAQALAEIRAQAREQVRTSGLPRHQARLAMPVAPVHVALVGGQGDPALDGAAERLRASGYGVQLRVVPALLTGAGASGRVAEALARVAGHSELVLLLRGEGRDLELAAFDGNDLARAVAATPVPVVAGLGGRGEWTVCDEVAATSVSTADAAVDLVLAQLSDAEHALRTRRAAVRAEAEAGLTRARGQLEAARTAVEAVGEKAAARAEEAARRRWQVLLAGCGTAALALVIAAVALSAPALLLGLLLVAAVLGVGRQHTTGTDRRGNRPMALDEVSFAQVLERLERIRDELARTSTPEVVRSLLDESRQLVSRGEQVLGRGLDGPVASAPGLRPDDIAPTEIAPTEIGQSDIGQSDIGHSAMADDERTRALSTVRPTGEEVTSVVVRAAEPATGGEQQDTAGDDMRTQRQGTGSPVPPPLDAETTQVLPTQGRR